MYTGEIIDELTKMVARAEDQAHSMRPAELTCRREEQPLASRLVCAPEAQPMMIGVA